MGELKIVLTVFIIIIAIVCWEIDARRKRPGPMYPKFRDELEERRVNEKLPLPRSFICPWCRVKCFRPAEEVSYTTKIFKSVFCDDCQKEIYKLHVKDERPDFVDEHDWIYISRKGKDDSFWMIYRDYQLGDISKEEARKLVHNLVPSDFGKIKPIKYRNNTVYQWHDVNYNTTTCDICSQPSYKCTCYKTYAEEVERGKYPSKFNPYFARLKELKPTYVLSFYEKEKGKIRANMRRADGFSPLDFYSKNDWQTIQFLSDLAARKEYTEEEVEEAIDNFINLIIRDLKIQIEYYEAINRGEDVEFPVLPSVNIAKVKEVCYLFQGTTPSQVREKFMN